MTNRIEFIKEHLLSKNNVSLFTGAGISCSSQLPLAKGLLEYIFYKTMPEEIKQNENYMLNIDSFPFEAYVELMVGYTGNYDIFNIFNGDYQPNNNHYIACQMQHAGYLDKIYTVNFDMLYEKAFKQYSYDYKVLYKDEQFSDANMNDAKNNIIKLHGSAHDHNSMKFVLESITNKIKRTQRENAVKHMFAKDNHTIVIFGYSISDKFDITPAIERITDKKSTVIFVNHSDGPFYITSNNNYDGNRPKAPREYPFIAFPGYYIEDNTDAFMRDWYNLLWGIQWEERPTKHADENQWSNKMEKFNESLRNESYKFYGTIYNRIGKYSQSIRCFKQIAQNSSHKDYAFACQQLAQMYNILDEPDKSIVYLNEAIAEAERQKNPFIKISCLFVKAEYGIKKGEYDYAVENYRECYILACDAKLRDKAIQSLQGISYVLALKKDFENAYAVNEDAIRMASEEDDLWLLSDLYNNKADLLLKQNKFDESLIAIGYSIKLKKNLQDYPNLVLSEMTKGTILKNSKRFEEAESVYCEAEIMCGKHGLTEIEPKIYYQEAVLNMTDGWQHPQKAMEKLQKAIPIFKKQGKLHEEGCSRIMLGQLYDHWRKCIAMQWGNLSTHISATEMTRPLSLDFNVVPIYLDYKEINERLSNYNSEYEDGKEDTDKINIVFKMYDFVKRLAHEELVQGLKLVKNTDIDYYQKVIAQYDNSSFSA